MKTISIPLLCVCLGLPLGAAAQDASGPLSAGSDLYPGGFSFELGLGAALPDARPLDPPLGPPLFLSLTASWWTSDWLLLDVSGEYVLATDDVGLLVGPRFRSAFYPVSASAGLKVGAFVVPGEGPLLGFSPQVGADILILGHLLLGLGYALDVPMGAEAPVVHRVFMSAGYRL